MSCDSVHNATPREIGGPGSPACAAPAVRLVSRRMLKHALGEFSEPSWRLAGTPATWHGDPSVPTYDVYSDLL
jgi:hypothetical protein